MTLDGRKGLLKTLVTRKTSAILRSEIAELVKKHARTAPIAANSNLAYASTFFNWCVEEESMPVADLALGDDGAGERAAKEERTASAEFGRGDMACQRVDARDSNGSLSETVDVLVAQVPDANTRALFSGFARIREGAA